MMLWFTRLLFVSLIAVIICRCNRALGQESGSTSVALHKSNRNHKTVVLYLDVSGSIQGKRAHALREGAKLAVAILNDNQEIVIVSFCDTAHTQRFQLRTSVERRAAMQHIDALRIGGGTNYLCALQAAKLPRNAPGIFLSDGEHNGHASPVLAHLRQHKPGPLFTIALKAPPKADKLLSEMAALTGGSHVRVEQSEALVKVLLELSKNLSNYRSYAPKEERVECRGVDGKLVVIGFNAVAAVFSRAALPPIAFQHQASLPGEHVHLTSLELARPTDVTIVATRKRSPSGRLAAILRQDLFSAHMKLHAPDGKAGAGTNLKVTTEFVDRQGRVVDPRGRTDLSSTYQLLDDTGKILQKIAGKPSSSQPCFEATIPLPRNPRPVTIRNITKDASHGPAFEAEQSRTLILQKPIAVSIHPASLTLAFIEGRFETSLKVKTDEPITATFSALLENAASGLQLLEARSKPGELKLVFDAKAGKYKGMLVIDGASSVPLRSARIPFEFDVANRSLGLALPATRQIVVGPMLGNSGSKAIATLEFPGLDAEDVPFTVDVEDLSNGLSIIPCAADQLTFKASKSRTGKITLTAEIGNVGNGDYTGAVLVKHVGGKHWRTNLTLRVSEPLSATPLDFGKVEVGKRVKGTFMIQNASGAVRGVRLQKAFIKAKGGSIVIEIPSSINLPARQQTEVPVTLLASPLIESRGLHRGSLTVLRAGNQTTACLLSVEIVDAGKGPCTLLAAPRMIVLNGRPGDVLQFDVRTKFAAGATSLSDELAVSAGNLKHGTGATTNVELAFKWISGKTLKRSSPATARGFIVVPDQLGTFTTTVTISSVESGTFSIPLTLNVQ